LAAWPWVLGPLVEIAQIGIGSQFAKLMEFQGSHASNKFLFAVSTIGDDVTQAAQVIRLDHTAELVEIDIHPGGLGLRGGSTGWCLLDTEAVCAVVGDIEPGQGGDFKPFFRTAMAPVPKAIKAIGVLATFGHETGVHDQSLIMLRRDDLGDSGFVE
jgi:hypothetical protein